jgi:hypothetical protein
MTEPIKLPTFPWHLSNAVKDDELCAWSVVQTYARLAVEQAVAAEREACAKVCDTEWNGDSDTYDATIALNECAAAIRARGEK